MFPNQKTCFSLRQVSLALSLAIFLSSAALSARPQSASQAPAPTAAAPDTAQPHGQIQYLWPDGAPGAVGTEEQDKPHLEIFSGYGPAPAHRSHRLPRRRLSQPGL